MKKVLTYSQYITEGIRDKMTPVSEKDVRRNFEKIDGLDFIKIIEANFDDYFTDEELIEKIKTFSEMDLTMNFQHSIGYNKVRLVELFLRAGVDIHYNKDWPIYYAAKEGYTEILKLLLDKGVDPNSDNGTSIYAALTNKEFQCLDMLLNTGGNFDKFLDDPKYSKYIDDYNDYKKVNEGVKDKMTPKSKEDIKISLEPLMVKIARELTFMSNSRDICGMEDFEEAYPFVVSKIAMIQDLVLDHNYTDPEEIALFLASTYLDPNS